MTRLKTTAGTGRFALTLALTACVGFAVPSAVFALSGQNDRVLSPPAEFTLFTPASVDPALAKRVAESLRAKGMDLRFTPASSTRDQTVTVAIRINDRAAQSISNRILAPRTVSGIPQSQPGSGTAVIASTRYDLGIARGYQGFAQSLAQSPALAKPSLGKSGLAKSSMPTIKSVDMPDLADFKPSQGSAPDKPSRFKSRIALDKDTPIGRSPQTREALSDQFFDLGGAYRVTRNLDVTAGVRLSQERDRIDPLTDDVQDSQAVYVGTQFRF